MTGAGRVAVLAAVALGLAAVHAVGDARLAAIDGGGAALGAGERISARAVLLERPRPGPFGASAAVELVTGRHQGAKLLARFPAEPGGSTGRPGSMAGAQPGAELRLDGTFARAERGEGDFDLAAHLRRRGIAGELTVDRVEATGGRRGGAAGILDRVRARALAGIAAGLDPPLGALAQGMVLGADEQVPASVRDDFRDSGLAHLMAASGQNVMLLVALVVPLLAAAGLSHRARIPVLIALVALYVPLAGGGPSIQRAGVMGVAGLLAVLLARPASRWHALALAACATLVLNPRAWSEPGWQLSFAAVAGILLLAPGIARRLDALPAALAGGVALTTAATAATAPLVAHHFGAVSLASLPANVAALPLVAPIMWLGTLRALLAVLRGPARSSVDREAALAPPSADGGGGAAADGGAADAGNALAGVVAEGGEGPLGAIAGFADGALALMLGQLTAAIGRLAATFADAPASTVAVRLDGLGVAAAYVALAAVALVARAAVRRADTRASTAVAYLRRLPRGRRVAFAVAGLALLGLAAAHGLAPERPPATLAVSFLDVGQGDATLVQHPDGTAALFDGGPPEAGVVRLLRRAGVRRLSALVMTHASRDHHGGLAEVVERVPVDVLLDGGDGTRDRDYGAIVASAVRHGARRVPATAPLTLHAGALRIDVLSPFPRPPGPPPEDPNPRAVVAIVSSDGFRLLLSGDAESGALLQLPLPDVDAMKLPHHGSADPGLPDLLDRLRPEIASIPVGRNTYGHPAPSTLAALRAAGVPTWRNDRHGTIRLTIDHDARTVTPDRGESVSLSRR